MRLDTELIALHGSGVSITLEPAVGGPPLWRHFGARTAADTAWPLLGARPTPQNALDGEVAFSLLPGLGLGWFQQPALLGARPGDATGEGSDWAQHFEVERIDRHEHGLSIVLRDEVAALGLVLHLTLDPATDVLVTWAELENRDTTPFRVDWLAAACVPLPPEADRVIGFHGRWALEFQQARETLGIATWRRDSRRGRNAHDGFPGVIVGTTLADDGAPTWGAHLAWSGNHTLLIEPLPDGRRQLQMGEWLAPGEVVLAPGERYRTPEALLSYSGEGLNGLAAHFHRHLRRHVLRWPGGAMAPRPVHLNTWEAVYFDHDLEGLKALASAGAEVGIERFVLDDGWFHRRDDDRAALGDWWPDERKYPEGLGPLVEHVRSLGLQFGLWVEPEMVNPDSELYRAHPDWALQMAGRPVLTGRNQLVLDFTRAEVVEHLFAKLDALLREHAIAYLKWDMNRDIATAASGAGHRGRAAYRRHNLALYALLARLRAAHPAVEIESCSSGGARADAGILKHTHRVWTSDCNDALTRIGIQSGFLRFMPPEVMGAHIGPAHSHTTGRRHALAFRAAVALFGHLGVEADVRRLDAAERAELARWIGLYKQWRDRVHGGTLRQGEHGGRAWLQSVADDGRAALVAIYRRREEDLRHAPPLPVPGLEPQRRYRVRALYLPPQRQPPAPESANRVFEALAEGTLQMSGAQLAEGGLPVPAMPPESAMVVGIEALP